MCCAQADVLMDNFLPFLPASASIQDASETYTFTPMSHLSLYTTTPGLCTTPMQLRAPQQVARTLSIDTCSDHVYMYTPLVHTALDQVMRVHEHYVKEGSFSYVPEAGGKTVSVPYPCGARAAALLYHSGSMPPPYDKELGVHLCHITEVPGSSTAAEEEELPYITEIKYGVGSSFKQIRVRSLVQWRVSAANDNRTSVAPRIPGQDMEPYPMDLLMEVGMHLSKHLHMSIKHVDTLLTLSDGVAYCANCGKFQERILGDVCCSLNATYCGERCKQAHLSKHAPMCGMAFAVLQPLGDAWVLKHDGSIAPYVRDEHQQDAVSYHACKHMASISAENGNAFAAAFKRLTVARD